MCYEGLRKTNCNYKSCRYTMVLQINESGLCINRKDLHMTLIDRNMPKDVKKTVLKIFPHLEERKYYQLTFWRVLYFARKFPLSLLSYL